MWTLVRIEYAIDSISTFCYWTAGVATFPPPTDSHPLTRTTNWRKPDVSCRFTTLLLLILSLMIWTFRGRQLLLSEIVPIVRFHILRVRWVKGSESFPLTRKMDVFLNPLLLVVSYKCINNNSQYLIARQYLPCGKLSRNLRHPRVCGTWYPPFIWSFTDTRWFYFFFISSGR